MGACNNKSNKDSPAVFSKFSNFLYFDRRKGKLIRIIKKKLTKTKIKSHFFYSPDSALCTLSNHRLMFVGGSKDGLLSDECSIFSVTSKKVLNKSCLPFKARLGNLHEHGDWVYYVGGHLSAEGAPAPILKYNQRANTWLEMPEVSSSSSIKSLTNFGSCIMNNKIMIFGGEFRTEGLVESSQIVLSVSLDTGTVKNEGEFPCSLAFPVVAAGEKHGIVVGGIDLKTKKFSHRGFYLMVKDGKLEVHKLDKVKVDIIENYPPVYTKDYALFVNYPHVLVRFRNEIQWSTFSLKSNHKASKNESLTQEKRPNFLSLIKTEIPEQPQPENLAKVKKNKSSSSSSSSKSSKKKAKKHKKPIQASQNPSNSRQNSKKLEADVFEDITIDNPKPEDFLQITSDPISKSETSADSKSKVPKITVSKLEDPSQSPRVSTEPKPALKPEDSNALDPSFSIQLNPATFSQVSPRHNSEVKFRKIVPVHVKSLSSPDVLRLEGGNAVNKVQVTIKKRLSDLGKLMAEYTIKKQSSYSDSSSSSSSSKSQSSAKHSSKAKPDSAELKDKEETFKSGCVAEFLNISPRNNCIDKEEDLEDSHSSKSQESDERTSKQSSGSSSSSDSSDSSESSDDSSSDSFPVPVRVKRTHTIASVDSSEVSDEENDECLSLDPDLLLKFKEMISLKFDLGSSPGDFQTSDIGSTYKWLSSVVPANTYSITEDFLPIITNLHELFNKRALKEKEKWNIVLSSRLLPEDDQISSQQLAYALSRGLKYMLLRAG